jgi:TonB-linked SusC/RagA family outer membrane protein
MSRILVLRPLLVAFAVLFSFSQALAQQSLTGTVTDARDGSTLPGVNIIVVGTTVGTITDLDGKFTLAVPAGSKELSFSMIGYSVQTFAIGANPVFNVSLKEETKALDEVVVTGYGGTQKRSKLTNSISTVKDEVLKSGVYSNPAQALSGAVSGLKVTQTSGKPGATPTLVIRGGTNLDGSGSPLVIVDGQLRGINDLNPEDIESMEVLKDAGATALYGARANNGVLLITTKHGKKGFSEITLKSKLALNYMNEPYQFLGAADYLWWARMGVNTAARMYQKTDGSWAGSTNTASLSTAQAYGTGNVYWDANGVALDGNKTSSAIWSPMLSESLTAEKRQYLLDKGYREMTDPVTGKQIIYSEFIRSSTAFNNPALTQEYNIQMTGGNDKGSYYAGLGYHYAKGLPVKTWYQRLTFTFNADYKINDWLTSSSSLSYNDARWYDVTTNTEGNYFARMLSAPPTLRQFNDAGEMLLGNNMGDGNPLFNVDNFIRDNQSDKYTMVQSFKVDLMKGLFLKVNANWMFDEGFYESFNKDYLNSPGTWITSRSSSANFDRTLRQTYNAILNYDFKFGDGHTITALTGSEFYDTYNKGFSGAGSGAPTSDFMDLNYTSTKEGLRSIDSWHARSRILSFFGRANYDYKEKYLVALTARQDGYSILLDNRWGFFPGVSAGWVVSKEDFMKDFMQNHKNIISFLKLRASYGLNGNVSGIGTYELQGSYGSYLYGGNVGYALGSLPNPSLLWERSNTAEGGFDIGLFENKINANFTYYNRRTLDKYASIPLPISSGYGSIRSNNGELKNTGIELDLSAKVLRKKDLHWDLSANITYNKNTIMKLPDNGLERNRQSAFQVYSGGKDASGNYIMDWVGGYQEGQTPGGMWAFQSEGIFKDDAQVLAIAGDRQDITSGNNGSNGRKLVGPNIYKTLTDAQKATIFPIQPGDVIWKDVNGDNTIDNYDRVYVGNSIPKWFGGISTNVSWKGFVLSARMDYALGAKQSDAILPWFMGMMQGTYNTVVETKETWTPDNTGAKYPRYMWADQLGKRNYARESSMFIYDASYLAFREVSLMYAVPKDLFGRTGIKGAEASITGQNLGYLTASKLYSPEAGGSQGGGYGLPRTLIFGLNLKF